LDIGDSAANHVEEEYNPEQESSSRMKLMVEMNVLEMLRKPEHAMKQLVKPKLTANGDRMENGLRVPSHVAEDSKHD